MKHLSLFATMVLGCFILAGCGGGGATPHKLVVETNADGIAYRTSDLVWHTEMEKKESLGDGVTRYTIDIEGKYNVILSCNTNKDTILFALTTNESPLLRYKCLQIPNPTRKDLKGNISDQTGSPDQYYIATGDVSEGFAATQSTYTLSNVAISSHSDIASFTLKNIGGVMTPQRFYIQRDIDLTQTLTHDIDFTSSNSVPMELRSMQIANNTKAEIFLFTQNETFINMSDKNKWGYPTGLLTESDVYIKLSFNWNGMLKQEATTATHIKKEDITMDISYFKPLTQITYNANILGGLNLYKGDPKNAPLRGYYFELDQNNKNYIFMISKEFLVDDSDFSLPILPALPEFNGNWDGKNAADVVAHAVMCDLSIAEVWGKGEHITFTGIPFVRNHIVEAISQQVK